MYGSEPRIPIENHVTLVTWPCDCSHILDPMTWRRVCASCAGLMLVLAASALARDAPSPSGGQRAVLVLSLDDVTRPWSRLIFEGAYDVLQESAPDVAVYAESLDSTRFEGAEYTAGAHAWLRRKYGNVRVDLVIAVGQEAVQFLADASGEPWPGVPVLYLESGALTIDVSKSLPHATGVILESSFGAALSVMTTLLPGIERVAFVYGASAVERARFGPTVASLRRLHPNLEAVDLGGLAMDDLLRRVAALPPRTVIVNLTVQVDGAGRMMAPNRACELISAAANRPFFTLGSYDFGCGTVGGLLRDWKLAGQALGTRALQHLAGNTPTTTTVPIAEYCRLQFDARQLARWRIPERRLPAGSVVAFRPPSLWRDYRPAVLGALAFGLLQSALIGGLLFERRRRQRAEIQSRQHLTSLAHLDRRGAMGELAASLAHELSQPLTAILQNTGAAEMLLQEPRRADVVTGVREILADIRTDDQRASGIIDKMRRLLQKRELDLGAVAPGPLVRETAALVRSEASARGIQVDEQTSETLPAVRGDRVHLQQVLLNLLLNALDAVAGEPPDRRHVVVQASTSGDVVRFAVVDRGHGLPAERHHRIFEPFMTTKPDGMGMGLTIAQGIVREHNGRMGASSNEHRGATIWFEIPVEEGRPR